MFLETMLLMAANKGFDPSVVGAADEFANASAGANSAAKISATKFIVCWKGNVRVINTDGDNGPVTEYDSNLITFTKIGVLSESQAIIFYYDSTNSRLRLVLLGIDISDVITTQDFDTPWTGLSSKMDMGIMSSNQAMLVHHSGNSPYNAMARVVDISGTTSVLGSVRAFASDSAITQLKLSAVTSSKALLFYEISNTIRSLFLSVSGSAVTESGEDSLSHNPAYPSLVVLSETLAAMVYSHSSDGYICPIDISGAIPSFGAPVLFESGNPYHIATCALDPKNMAINYTDIQESNKGKTCAVKFSGAIPMPGIPQVFYEGGCTDKSNVALTTMKIVCCYKDTDDSGHGKVRLIG